MDLYFVECKSSSITTPEPVIPGSESFRITSRDVLVTLQTKLDYEENNYYTLVLQVEDETMALTGPLIIRVGYMLFFVIRSQRFLRILISNAKKYSEWVSYCYLTPSQQFFSYIMARTSYISMRWWRPLCSIPTRFVGF